MQNRTPPPLPLRAILMMAAFLALLLGTLWCVIETANILFWALSLQTEISPVQRDLLSQATLVARWTDFALQTPFQPANGPFKCVSKMCFPTSWAEFASRPSFL